MQSTRASRSRRIFKCLTSNGQRPAPHQESATAGRLHGVCGVPLPPLRGLVGTDTLACVSGCVRSACAGSTAFLRPVHAHAGRRRTPSFRPLAPSSPPAKLCSMPIASGPVATRGGRDRRLLQPRPTQLRITPLALQRPTNPTQSGTARPGRSGSSHALDGRLDRARVPSGMPRGVIREVPRGVPRHDAVCPVCDKRGANLHQLDWRRYGAFIPRRGRVSARASARWAVPDRTAATAGKTRADRYG